MAALYRPRIAWHHWRQHLLYCHHWVVWRYSRHQSMSGRVRHNMLNTSSPSTGGDHKSNGQFTAQRTMASGNGKRPLWDTQQTVENSECETTVKACDNNEDQGRGNTVSTNDGSTRKDSCQEYNYERLDDDVPSAGGCDDVPSASGCDDVPSASGCDDVPLASGCDDISSAAGCEGIPSVGGSTVLVTGGAGFLGQHLIALLQTHTSHVTRIKVLDLKPYRNLLGHCEKIPVECTVGSVTDLDLVTKVMEGVDSVFHVAGLISYGTFPDTKAMHNVNVQGTFNIVDGCRVAGVKRLIFCSTVDVVIGHDDVIGGCEVTTGKPSKFLFPGYPETKWKSECLVLDADGTQEKQGVTLKTLSLRANVMYGEGDPYYVTNGLRNAQRSGNVLYQVGDGSKVFQPAYVGNTAWAFICADKALARDNCKSGQFFFIPDDTPIRNTFKFLQPFLQIRGFRLSSFRLPFRLVYYLLLFSELVVTACAPIYRLQLPTESYSVKYINMNLCFSAGKAARELEYKPLFPPDVAMRRSLEYYKSVEL